MESCVGIKLRSQQASLAREGQYITTRLCWRPNAPQLLYSWPGQGARESSTGRNPALPVSFHEGPARGKRAHSYLILMQICFSSVPFAIRLQQPAVQALLKV